MPRAKANPDPAVIEYTSRAGTTFVIAGYRNGGYEVILDAAVIFSRSPKVNQGFGSPRWPSNRLQAEALADAKNWIEVFAHRRV